MRQGAGARGAEAALLFAALAEPIRWRLLDLLAVRGDGTATTLAAEVPVSRPAVVKHLAVLDRAGLVRRRRRGREVRFVVQPARLERAAGWLASVADEWDARLSLIRQIAEERPDGM